MNNQTRRQVNLIGIAAITVVAVVGTLLVSLPLFNAVQNAANQASASVESDRVTRAELAVLAKQDVWRAKAENDLRFARWQIPEADELRDASALASVAAKASGARIASITFAGRQVFARPAGVGLGEDGTPAAAQVPAEPGTPWVQLPVRFEVEVSNTAQAAAFLDGLRGGPRVLQVVQAQSSPTNGAELSIVTVDALIFAARR